MSNQKIYEMVTENIIAQLNEGIIPWEKPWTGVRSGAYNRMTKKPYSLINQMLLRKPGEYATYKQWQSLGGQVRKGEKAHCVVFWKVYRKETDETDENGEKIVTTYPVLRYYNVFHIDQVDGVEPLPEEELKEQDPIEAGENILKNYWERENVNVEIRKSDEAYFSPLSDRIVLPLREQFTNIAEFYSTAFHESTHSTGIKSRLDRGLGTKLAAFGGEDYSKEELVAELGSAMLMNVSGIENTHTSRNSAAYIQGWLRALQNDMSLMVSAASKAQKAVDFILEGYEPTGTDDDTNKCDDKENQGGTAAPAIPDTLEIHFSNGNGVMELDVNLLFPDSLINPPKFSSTEFKKIVALIQEDPNADKVAETLYRILKHRSMDAKAWKQCASMKKYKAYKKALKAAFPNVKVEIDDDDEIKMKNSLVEVLQKRHPNDDYQEIFLHRGKTFEKGGYTFGVCKLTNSRKVHYSIILTGTGQIVGSCEKVEYAPDVVTDDFLNRLKNILSYEDYFKKFEYVKNECGVTVMAA